MKTYQNRKLSLREKWAEFRNKKLQGGSQRKKVRDVRVTENEKKTNSLFFIQNSTFYYETRKMKKYDCAPI